VALDERDRSLIDELRRVAVRRLVEERAAGLSRAGWGALATLPATQRANLRVALAMTTAAGDPSEAGTLFLQSLREAKVRGERWSAAAEAELRRLLETDRVWTLLGIPEADRAAGLHGWALRRVLAHLGAGGRIAEQDGGRHGA